MIPDLIQHFNHLVELRNDDRVINEDGTRVNPVFEIAMEMLKKPANQITTGDILYVQGVLKHELAKRSFTAGGFFG